MIFNNIIEQDKGFGFEDMNARLAASMAGGGRPFEAPMEYEVPELDESRRELAVRKAEYAERSRSVLGRLSNVALAGIDDDARDALGDDYLASDEALRDLEGSNYSIGADYADQLYGGDVYEAAEKFIETLPEAERESWRGRLNGCQTEADGCRLMGELFRNKVRGQYTEQQKKEAETSLILKKMGGYVAGDAMAAPDEEGQTMNAGAMSEGELAKLAGVVDGKKLADARAVRDWMRTYVRPLDGAKSAEYILRNVDSLEDELFELIGGDDDRASMAYEAMMHWAEQLAESNKVDAADELVVAVGKKLSNWSKVEGPDLFSLLPVGMPDSTIANQVALGTGDYAAQRAGRAEREHTRKRHQNARAILRAAINRSTELGSSEGWWRGAGRSAAMIVGDTLPYLLRGGYGTLAGTADLAVSGMTERMDALQLSGMSGGDAAGQSVIETVAQGAAELLPWGRVGGSGLSAFLRKMGGRAGGRGATGSISKWLINYSQKSVPRALVAEAGANLIDEGILEPVASGIMQYGAERVFDALGVPHGESRSWTENFDELGQIWGDSRQLAALAIFSAGLSGAGSPGIVRNVRWFADNRNMWLAQGFTEKQVDEIMASPDRWETGQAMLNEEWSDAEKREAMKQRRVENNKKLAARGEVLFMTGAGALDSGLTNDNLAVAYAGVWNTYADKGYLPQVEAAENGMVHVFKKGKDGEMSVDLTLTPEDADAYLQGEFDLVEEKWLRWAQQEEGANAEPVNLKGLLLEGVDQVAGGALLREAERSGVVRVENLLKQLPPAEAERIGKLVQKAGGVTAPIAAQISEWAQGMIDGLVADGVSAEKARSSRDYAEGAVMSLGSWAEFANSFAERGDMVAPGSGEVRTTLFRGRGGKESVVDNRKVLGSTLFGVAGHATSGNTVEDVTESVLDEMVQVRAQGLAEKAGMADADAEAQAWSELAGIVGRAREAVLKANPKLHIPVPSGSNPMSVIEAFSDIAGSEFILSAATPGWLKPLVEAAKGVLTTASAADAMKRAWSAAIEHDPAAAGELVKLMGKVGVRVGEALSGARIEQADVVAWRVARGIVMSVANGPDGVGGMPASVAVADAEEEEQAILHREAAAPEERVEEVKQEMERAQEYAERVQQVGSPEANAPEQLRGVFVGDNCNYNPAGGYYLGLIEKGKLKHATEQVKVGTKGKHGVIAGRELTGNFQASAAPLYVWLRKDGSLWLISGRHRYELMMRDENIPAHTCYVFLEDAEHDEKWARMMDYENNMRDDQADEVTAGTYVRETGLSDAELEQRGLMRNASRSKRGALIGRHAREELWTRFSNGKIKPKDAEIVCELTRYIKDQSRVDEIQRRCCMLLDNGKSWDYIGGMVQLMVQAELEQGQQGWFNFGADFEAALERAATWIEKALRAVNENIELAKRGRDMSGKKADKAARLGIVTSAGEDVQQTLQDLQVLKGKLELIGSYPELRQQAEMWDGESEVDPVGWMLQQQALENERMAAEKEMEAEEYLKQQQAEATASLFSMSMSAEDFRARQLRLLDGKTPERVVNFKGLPVDVAIDGENHFGSIQLMHWAVRRVQAGGYETARYDWEQAALPVLEKMVEGQKKVRPEDVRAHVLLGRHSMPVVQNAIKQGAIPAPPERKDFKKPITATDAEAMQLHHQRVDYINKRRLEVMDILEKMVGPVKEVDLSRKSASTYYKTPRGTVRLSDHTLPYGRLYAPVADLRFSDTDAQVQEKLEKGMQKVQAAERAALPFNETQEYPGEALVNAAIQKIEDARNIAGEFAARTGDDKFAPDANGKEPVLAVKVVGMLENGKSATKNDLIADEEGNVIWGRMPELDSLRDKGYSGLDIILRLGSRNNGFNHIVNLHGQWIMDAMGIDNPVIASKRFISSVLQSVRKINYITKGSRDSVIVKNGEKERYFIVAIGKDSIEPEYAAIKSAFVASEEGRYDSDITLYEDEDALELRIPMSSFGENQRFRATSEQLDRSSDYPGTAASHLPNESMPQVGQVVKGEMLEDVGRQYKKSNLSMSMERNLAAVHSIPLDTMLQVEKTLGGLAKPSIAITRLDKPYSWGGTPDRVYLVGSPELADPQKGNLVYDRDAWTGKGPFLMESGGAYDYRKGEYFEPTLEAFVSRTIKKKGMEEGSDLRAQSAVQISTMEAVKLHREKLSDTEESTEQKIITNEALDSLIVDVVSLNKKGLNYEEVAYILAKVCWRSSPLADGAPSIREVSRDQAKRILNEMGIRVKDIKKPLVDKFVKAVGGLKNELEDYLESVPQRAVMFNEFEYAVMPESAKGTSGLNEMLQRNGIKPIFHDGTEEGRKAALAGLVNDAKVSFSVREAKNQGLFRDGVLEASNAVVVEPGVSFSVEALHASPHRFRKFTTDKMGTGEGAQAYGWGLYFAESKEVNREYYKNFASEYYQERLFQGDTEMDEISLKALVHDVFMRHGGDALVEDSEEAIVYSILREGAKKQVTDYENFLEEGGDDIPGLMAALRELEGLDLERKRLKMPVTNYRVELNADDSNLLMWDKRYSGQEIKDLLGEELFEQVYDEGDEDAELLDNGEGVYMLLRSVARGAKEASELLLKHGVKGIKYFDYGSRGDRKGTYNYVIFSGDDVKITGVNETGDYNAPWEDYTDPTATFSMTRATQRSLELLESRSEEEVAQQIMDDLRKACERLAVVLADDGADSQRGEGLRVYAEMQALLSAVRQALPEKYLKQGNLEMLLRWAAMYARMAQDGQVPAKGTIKGEAFEKFVSALTRQTQRDVLQGMSEEEVRDALMEMAGQKMEVYFQKVARDSVQRIDRFLKDRALERIEWVYKHAYPTREEGKAWSRGKMATADYELVNKAWQLVQSSLGQRKEVEKEMSVLRRAMRSIRAEMKNGTVPAEDGQRRLVKLQEQLAQKELEAMQVAAEQQAGMIEAISKELEGLDTAAADFEDSEAKANENMALQQTFGNWYYKDALEARRSARVFEDMVLRGKKAWSDKLQMERERIAWQREQILAGFDVSREEATNTRMEKRNKYRTALNKQVVAMGKGLMNFGQLMIALRPLLGTRFCDEKREQISQMHNNTMAFNTGLEHWMFETLRDITGLQTKEEQELWLQEQNMVDKTGIQIREREVKKVTLTYAEAKKWLGMTEEQAVKERERLLAEASGQKRVPGNVPFASMMDDLRKMVKVYEEDNHGVAPADKKFRLEAEEWWKVELRTTKDAVLFGILTFEQPDYEHLMHVNGITPETLDQMRRYVGPQMLRWGYAMREKLSEHGMNVAQVFEAYTGIPFNARESYFKGVFDQGAMKEQTLDQAVAAASGASGTGSKFGSLIPRRYHQSKINWDTSAVGVFVTTMQQQNNYVQTSDMIRSWRALLADKNFSARVEAEIGAGTMQQIRGWIELIEGAVAADVKMAELSRRWMRRLMGGYAKARLGGNIRTIIKQVSAMLNGYAGGYVPDSWLRNNELCQEMTYRKIGFGEYMQALARVLLKRGSLKRAEVKDQAYIYARKAVEGDGLLHVAHLAANQKLPGQQSADTVLGMKEVPGGIIDWLSRKAEKATERMMNWIAVVDAEMCTASALAVADVAYRNAVEQDKQGVIPDEVKRAEALRIAGMALDVAAQPQLRTQKGYWAASGAFGAMGDFLFMFRSDTLSKAGLWIAQMTSGEKMPAVSGWLAFGVMNSLVLAMLEGLRGNLGDDDDEWWQYALVFGADVLTNDVSALPFVGDAVRKGRSLVMGERYFSAGELAQIVPFWEVLEYGKREFKYIKNGASWDKHWNATAGLLSALGSSCSVCQESTIGPLANVSSLTMAAGMLANTTKFVEGLIKLAEELAD